MAASEMREHATVKGTTASPKDSQNPSELYLTLDSSPPVVERKDTIGYNTRLLMRRVPHPVAVITSSMPRHTPPESFHGMTVSSFNTVCLEPKVVVSFNVKQPSATYDAIQASGQFNVHLINSTGQGAAIAELFATGRGREAFKNDEQRNDDDEVTPSTLSTSELVEGEPDLLRTNSVMFTLQCKLLDQTVNVADHVIVLGTVLTYRLPPPVRVSDKPSLGICYVNRRYRRPGRYHLLPGQETRIRDATSSTGATPTSTAVPLSPEDGSSYKDDDSSYEEETIPMFY